MSEKTNNDAKIENNIARLSGYVAENGLPEYSHEIFGEKFYQFTLSISRISDTEDRLPITVSERLVDVTSLQEGDYVEVEGQVRTYNKHTDQKNRLMISVFAREITINCVHDVSKNADNHIKLRGFVCKSPIYRKTPLGREICDLLIAVNRPYGKSDYIPAICWGRNARFASSFGIGAEIEVHGRLQSRTYTKELEDKTVEKRTAYEMSVGKIELVEEN